MHFLSGPFPPILEVKNAKRKLSGVYLNYAWSNFRIPFVKMIRSDMARVYVWVDGKFRRAR